MDWVAAVAPASFSERGGQRHRVAGQLSSRGIGQVLPLPAHRHRKNPGDHRRHHQSQQPEHQYDQPQRISFPALRAVSATPSSPHPAAAADHAPHAIGHQRDRARPCRPAASSAGRRGSGRAPSRAPSPPEARRATASPAAPRLPRCWRVAASRPVANALGSASGTTQTLGCGSPDAMAISSTTFTSCFCSGVAGSISSQAPVAHSTRSAPYRQEYQQMQPADENAGDADEGNDVTVGARAGRSAVNSQNARSPPNPTQAKEQDEADGEPGRAPPVGLLLSKEVSVVAHAPRLVADRSTTGTARSPASSISQSSAGDALARPATRLVGNCICLVLYCVATSL